MVKILWDFGVATPWKGKCVITQSTDYETAMNYVYRKYGQQNVCSGYSEPYCDTKGIIAKYNYEIIEEVTL